MRKIHGELMGRGHDSIALLAGTASSTCLSAAAETTVKDSQPVIPECAYAKLCTMTFSNNARNILYVIAVWSERKGLGFGHT